MQNLSDPNGIEESAVKPPIVVQPSDIKAVRNFLRAHYLGNDPFAKSLKAVCDAAEALLNVREHLGMYVVYSSDTAKRKSVDRAINAMHGYPPDATANEANEYHQRAANP